MASDTTGARTTEGQKVQVYKSEALPSELTGRDAFDDEINRISHTGSNELMFLLFSEKRGILASFYA